MGEKMHKLNLKDYMVRVKSPDQVNPGQVVESEYPYYAKDSILNLLFIPELELSGAELIRQNLLAMKLEQCKDGEILLEDEEWERIKKAFDAFRGFDRNAVELVTRILEAPVVEAEEKKPQEE